MTSSLLFYHGTRADFEQFEKGQNQLIHLTPSWERAKEFALCWKGSPSVSEVQRPRARILTALVDLSRLFDPRTDDFALFSSLDWTDMAQEAQELSQSEWTQPQLETWLKKGEWQILELPCVQTCIRKAGWQGFWTHEMGNWGIALFSPKSAQIVDCHFLSSPQPKLKF